MLDPTDGSGLMLCYSTKKSGSEIPLSVRNCSRAKGDEGTRLAFILFLALLSIYLFPQPKLDQTS